MRITLDSLSVIDAIDRRGSFAAAAEELSSQADQLQDSIALNISGELSMSGAVSYRYSISG